MTVAALFGFVYGFCKDRRRHLVLSILPVVCFVLMSSYLVKFQSNLMPIPPFLGLTAALEIEAVTSLLRKVVSRWT
ncbi:MAG: hypothetical protein H5T64_11930 [Chloroflexi bacterium]|nr:hypothetical protein [Chloroflexota bacterium]